VRDGPDGRCLSEPEGWEEEKAMGKIVLDNAIPAELHGTLSQIAPID
jgi:hypothetical protein